RLKTGQLILPHEKSLHELELFQEVHLDHGRALREVINSGERDFSSLLPLLDDAHKFRDWVADQADDARLAREYYEAVSRVSWVDKLPAKVARIVLGSGISAVIGAAAGPPGIVAGAVVGAGISAFTSAGDSF